MLRLLVSMAIFVLSVHLQSTEAAGNQKPYEFEVIPYAAPETLEMEVVLRNTASYPLDFEFPTSQKYDITINDKNGNEVYLYSRGKAFLQALQTLTLNPDESMIWKEQWNYAHEGKRVSEGEYQINAILQARKINGETLVAKETAEASVYIPGENPAFRQTKVSGEKGNYIVTGEARPVSGKLCYTVEDGHNELITEQPLKTNTKDWEPFKIDVSIPADKLPESGSVVLHLYERSKRDGSIIHSFPVLLEKRS
ncbi:hypothetical protein J7I93_12510 [Bacillus sp. ISL-47]|uniref:BsuPI-related putative proteinase inhibitor n=1 Tax=Bacillus sp. ISL-47 TaxID=2819130 RepID=UPI001BE60474|nr:BsuPI-related putative proteinase inhibitor [Bacillus sp. ISL-47]MBT2689008.1 hypothetical protein [Bacillus sp. ISL-47]MBT2708712.1 hypothetical protein [Pseudomonas sp. ISL-84]